jgi:Aspartyl protease
MAATAVLTVGVVLAGCSSGGTGSEAPHPTPHVSTTTSCNHLPRSQAAVESVPMTISTVMGGMLATVGVCLGKSGPYPFVVDTGSTRSIIDTAFAASRNLKGAGTVALGGSGCATTGKLVKVPALHVSDVAIAAQDMVSAPLNDWSGQSVDGVLGSDVLGRFGAVKLDLPKEMLTLAGAEGPAPTSHQLIVGKAGTAPPPSLLSGTPVVNVPMTIVQSPGTISAYTSVGVRGKGPYPFIVDTGSPFSAMSAGVAFGDVIADHGTGVAPGGVGCTGTVPVLEPTPVAMGSLTQTVSTMRGIKFEGPLRAGVDGALAIDFLGTSGTIVVDYAGADLALASG